MRRYSPDPLEVLTAMFDAPCLLPAQRIVMWTYPCMVRPALSAVRHGAGDLLLALAPMNHRPRYYLVWIDAAWYTAEGNDDGLREHLDDIWFALEEEFGRRECKDNGDFRSRYYWPEVDDGDGCCWRRARPEDILTTRARRRLIPSWTEHTSGVRPVDDLRPCRCGALDGCCNCEAMNPAPGVNPCDGGPSNG